MMKNMGDLLSPLNYWDSQDKKLDQWQINVIDHIKNKQSVIVKAPTSSGKSWVAWQLGYYIKIIFIRLPNQWPIKLVTFYTHGIQSTFLG